MRLRSRELFECVRTEGGLLPSDLLQRIADNDRSLEGLTLESYHLASGERLNEAITRSWNRLLGAWAGFSAEREKLAGGETGAKLTRERWLHVLFDELGYGRLVQQDAVVIEEKRYPVFTQWQHCPIHLVGCGVPLDRRTPGVQGAAGQSPHSLLQELLNRSSERLWGFATNGLSLRVLRDNVSLTRQAYVEFDLESIFGGGVYSDFVLLWLVCHQSRVEAATPAECRLEEWCRTAADGGVQALDQLRFGVERAISELGSGFLAHPANAELHASLRSGDLDAQDYYRQLLRLVYRLLFLFVAEDRGALLAPGAGPTARRRYLAHYSTRRLRTLAARRRGGGHHDLYEQFRVVSECLHHDGHGGLGLPALGSFLWSPEAVGLLGAADLPNTALLGAVRELAYVEDRGVRRAVDFRNLGAEELGSIYESLLELHPRLHRETAKFELATAAGHERKTTGSYYTPTSLITTLLDSALDPVLEAAAAEPDAQQAILALTVCDPACGSGHFLIAAANRIAKRLASVRTGDSEPAPEAMRAALRDVIGRCIHGVDVNPMAVELCKVSLWLEALEPGKPLSFLDHRIVVGNSLLGATPALVAAGVPDDAFRPIMGDDKQFTTALRKRNAAERAGQLEMDVADALASARGLVRLARWVDEAPDATLEGIAEREERYAALLASEERGRAQLLADAWCAACVAPKRPGAPALTTATLNTIADRSARLDQADRLVIDAFAAEYRFVHWHIAFPDVFRVAGADGDSETGWAGGFDVLLGNPPWDRPKPEAATYFSASYPEIAQAPSAAIRARRLAGLEAEDPIAYERWKDHERHVLGVVAFLVRSSLFKLTATGKFNLGNTFLELALRLTSSNGRAGLLNISGIATDDSGKHFISTVMETQRLVSLLDFENRDGLFPGVHRSYRFSVITLAGSPTGERTDFVFFARNTNDLEDQERHVRFTADDIRLLNPVTQNCPVFRNAHQGEIVKALYRAAELRGPDASVLFQWDVEPTFLFVMSDHSHLFTTGPKLGLETDLCLDGVRPEVNGSRYLPLYEAKMFNQFDHRWSSLTSEGKQVVFADQERADSARVAVPRYWMREPDAARKLDALPNAWLIAIREVTNATNERTAIAAVLPKYPVGHNAQVFSFREAPRSAASLLANLNSLCLDFAARSKVGGSHLSSFILRQLPILPRSLFAKPCPWMPAEFLEDWIYARVLELTFTAWDLAKFARDCGYSGAPFRWDAERRISIRAEVDAAFMQLYGLSRDDATYVMDAFPIVAKRDLKTDGEYRTKRLILERYDAMAEAIASDAPYESPLDPPPGSPAAAHEAAVG